jgi:hypothetical protein
MLRIKIKILEREYVTIIKDTSDIVAASTEVEVDL